MANPVANPYYDDPWLTQAASNISKIFVDADPGKTAVQRAQGRYYTLEGDKLQDQAASRKTIGGIFSGANGRALTPQEYATITGSGITGGVDPKQYQEGNVFYTANTGQPDSAVARAIVGSGKVIGKDQGVSLEDRNAVAQRDNDAAMARTRYSADSSAGATITSANIHERGANDRADKTDQRTLIPVFVTDDSGNHVVDGSGQPAVKMVPKSDFAKSGGNNPVLPNSYYEKGQDKTTGKPTFGTPGGGNVVPFEPAERFVQTPGPNGTSVYTRAKEGVVAVPPKTPADHFVPTPDPHSPTGYSLAPAGSGVPVVAPAAATPKPPPAINSDELVKVEQDALASVGVADPANKFAVDPQFTSSEYAAKVPAAREAAAAEYQRTRNAAQAQAAYVAALGVPANSKWNAPGAVGRVFGGKPGFQGPQGAAPPPAAAAAPAGLPPEAASRLRAGVNTTFGNGQMWTIQNGVPTRVR